MQENPKTIRFFFVRQSEITDLYVAKEIGINRASNLFNQENREKNLIEFMTNLLCLALNLINDNDDDDGGGGNGDNNNVKLANRRSLNEDCINCGDFFSLDKMKFVYS